MRWARMNTRNGDVVRRCRKLLDRAIARHTAGPPGHQTPLRLPEESELGRLPDATGGVPCRQWLHWRGLRFRLRRRGSVVHRGLLAGSGGSRARKCSPRTFSTPKSASVLWAVEDAGTQSLIADAPHWTRAQDCPCGEGTGGTCTAPVDPEEQRQKKDEQSNGNLSWHSRTSRPKGNQPGPRSRPTAPHWRSEQTGCR